jgi:hypothetical protein
MALAPGVNLALQRVSLVEKCAILGPKIINNPTQAHPERICFYARARSDLVAYQRIQCFVDS